MSVTADMVRGIIVAHDAGRPRSQQTAVGPSDLSSPCSRKLVYQILGVPKVADDGVNLAAWVGTGIHAQMEAALRDDPDWVTEQKVTITLSKTLTLSGSMDAYHRPTGSVVDWKGVGPSALQKYRRASPDKYLNQVALYGLAAVLSGKYHVSHCAIVYIPRNGDLSDIHVDCHPWDQDRADAALARLEALHAAAKAGPAVLPLIPTADDCTYCAWWSPGSDDPTTQCPGVNPRPQLSPWEPS